MHLQTILALLIISNLGPASAQKGSHCESSCGNVTIHFPFGSEEGCYYNQQFLLSCNRSVDEPTPFYGDVAVRDISLSTGEMEIMMFVAHDCYSRSGYNTISNDPNLNLASFRISTKNKFVAIGCDTHAYIEGSRGNESDDIDECKNSKFNNCTHICHDIEGSYECKCPKGYSGDGKKNGSGCTLDQSLIITITICTLASILFLLVFVTWVYVGVKKRKLLVELLTGRKALCFDMPENERNLAQYFLSSLKEGRISEVLDAHLQLDEVPNEVIQVSKLAERCLRVKGDERPTMKEVAIELEGILASTIHKHPWVQSSFREEEAENLLEQPMEA
ncbi:hypothetical protein L1987_16104 [Smallanthus sonchifolius]|uniref:Uncharacterized protein n=1 Tax=Smallanthus sonchifolius TaxID=185202 RepID=A0ACB9JA31_9ASTR|nr:hypothetical protein L1987_16104 [Smallanthus sonchifolius]